MSRVEIISRAWLPIVLLTAACGHPPTPTVAPDLVFGQRGRDPGRFRVPDGLTVDRQGKIYVGDVHGIHVFLPSGKFSHFIGREGTRPGEFRNEVPGVALLPDDRIVATDRDNFRVQIFSQSGEVETVFGGRGLEPGRFLAPEGIVTDPEGRIYVADREGDNIQVFSADGKLLLRFAASGSAPGRLREPEAMAIHQERLFVTDEANFRISVFSRDGQFLQCIGAPPSRRSPAGPEQDLADIAPPVGGSFSRDVEGLACDSSGNLYAADEGEGTILVFDPRGVRLGHFQSTAPGGLRRIQGLCIDPQGKQLYVLDLGNARIQVFSLAKIRQALKLQE